MMCPRKKNLRNHQWMLPQCLTICPLDQQYLMICLLLQHCLIWSQLRNIKIVTILRTCMIEQSIRAGTQVHWGGSLWFDFSSFSPRKRSNLKSLLPYKSFDTSWLLYLTLIIYILFHLFFGDPNSLGCVTTYGCTHYAFWMTFLNGGVIFVTVFSNIVLILFLTIWFPQFWDQLKEVEVNG